MKAMILAAGRGKRMRPLTDMTPKPLLKVGGKPLIVWQIERLSRAGFNDIVINHAWLGAQIEACLGDGRQWGVRITWSRENEALETAGGIAYARHYLGEAPFLTVSADIYSEYDYSTLIPILKEMGAPHSQTDVHLVMVPNPPFHTQGDFGLTADGRITLEEGARLTYGNFCLQHPRIFKEIASGTYLPLYPVWKALIEQARVTGECFQGVWENVGTTDQLKALDERLHLRNRI